MRQSGLQEKTEKTCYVPQWRLHWTLKLCGLTINCPVVCFFFSKILLLRSSQITHHVDAMIVNSLPPPQSSSFESTQLPKPTRRGTIKRRYFIGQLTCQQNSCNCTVHKEVVEKSSNCLLHMYAELCMITLFLLFQT